MESLRQSSKHGFGEQSLGVDSEGCSEEQTHAPPFARVLTSFVLRPLE